MTFTEALNVVHKAIFVERCGQGQPGLPLAFDKDVQLSIRTISRSGSALAAPLTARSNNSVHVNENIYLPALIKLKMILICQRPLLIVTIAETLAHALLITYRLY